MRTAYLAFTGRGERAEFCGVFPSRQDAYNAANRQCLDGMTPYIEQRQVSKYELENIKEDDVSDDEWALYV